MKLILDFCGASGVGKTTLIEALKDSRSIISKKTYIQKSASRDVSYSKATSEKTIPATQYEISLHNWSDILSNIVNNDIIFSTDFLIRSLAYSLCADVRDKQLISCHENFLKFFTSTLSFDGVHLLFFFIPIEFAIDSDGVRSTDVKYHDRVSKTILDIYEKFNISYTILTGSVVGRLETVLRRITPYL